MTPERHEGVWFGKRPPKVRIMESICRRHRPLSHAIDPRRRNNLLAVPRAFVKVEIAKLRHVVRREIKAAFAVRDALRVRVAPPDARNTQWLEQFVSCKI